MILGFIAFISVFLLGFQQKNVMHDKYWGAIFTSFLISMSQFTIYREVVAADTWDWVYMGIGGAVGIVSSMYIHNKLRKKKSCTKEK